MKKIIKNIGALSFGIFVALVIFEIFLHIYNPFQTRLSGNVITLPVNQKYEFNHVAFHGLDEHIVHTKNKFGFRGSDKIENNAIKIIFIGGSTTECYYLSDGKDWPSICSNKLKETQANIWYNNAGLDGHSTFGHKLLLQDHVLKYQPNYVFFLVGANDVASKDMNRFENALLKSKKRFLQNFEIYNLYLNIKLSRLAKKRGVAHTPIDFKSLKPVAVSDTINSAKIDQELLAYKNRLLELIKICLDNNIRPVFITQPCLLKPGLDPETGINTGTYPFAEGSGLKYYSILNQYNETTKTICKNANLHCIDAAKLIPSSSEYYYDYFHYTNAGAMKLGNIISTEILRLNIIK